jgi:hypothetical protein
VRNKNKYQLSVVFRGMVAQGDQPDKAMSQVDRNILKILCHQSWGFLSRRLDEDVSD